MGSMTPSPCAKLTQACDGVGKRSSGITDLRQDPLRENTAVQAVPRCPVSVGGVVIPEQTHRTELRSEDNELNDYDSRKTKRGWTRGPHVAWQRDALFFPSQGTGRPPIFKSAPGASRSVVPRRWARAGPRNGLSQNGLSQNGLSQPCYGYWVSTFCVPQKPYLIRGSITDFCF